MKKVTRKFSIYFTRFNFSLVLEIKVSILKLSTLLYMILARTQGQVQIYPFTNTYLLHAFTKESEKNYHFHGRGLVGMRRDFYTYKLTGYTWPRVSGTFKSVTCPMYTTVNSVIYFPRYEGHVYLVGLYSFEACAQNF